MMTAAAAATRKLVEARDVGARKGRGRPKGARIRAATDSAMPGGGSPRASSSNQRVTRRSRSSMLAHLPLSKAGPKIPPHRLAGIVQPRLHGPDRYVQRGGDLGQWQACVEVQDDDRAMVQGEALEGPPQGVTLFRAEGPIPQRRVVGELHLSNPAARHGARLVVGSVDRQAHEPGRERGVATKLRKVAPRPEQCLLTRILCTIPVPQDKPGGGVDAWQCGPDEVVERIGVTPPGSSDLFFLSLGQVNLP